MTQLPTTDPPGFVFRPAPPPNFDPSTGSPIEYGPDGHPIHVIQNIVAPQLPPGVSSYDPYTGAPLDAQGHPVPGVHNPHGQHVFTTRLEDRQGVDPSGHVIAQRPDYDTDTGLPIRYDAHGNPLVPLVDTEKPPGVDHYDAETGAPVDVHGHPVPGVENPHLRPVYDEATGLPIHYDDDGNGNVIQIGVSKPPGVDHYDPRTGDPLDAQGHPVPGAHNPFQLPEHRDPPETPGDHDAPPPNFDPVTGVPLEYDADGNAHPITDLVPQHPAEVVGFDPVTGEPLDAAGHVVEDYDNPLGEHVFTTNLDAREGVDPTGHAIAQRPMYDDATGKPIFYDDQGHPMVPTGPVLIQPGVASFDPDTGEPLDAQGRPVPGVDNPFQRPDYDADNGLPIEYDDNGNPVPNPPIVVTVPPGVAGFDPDTGEPVDVNGDPLPGVSNPFQRPEDRHDHDVVDTHIVYDQEDARVDEPAPPVLTDPPADPDGVVTDPTLVGPPLDDFPTTVPTGPAPDGPGLGTGPWPGGSPFEGEGVPVAQGPVLPQAPATTDPVTGAPTGTVDPFGGAPSSGDPDPFGEQPTAAGDGHFATSDGPAPVESHRDVDVPQQDGSGQHESVASHGDDGLGSDSGSDSGSHSGSHSGSGSHADAGGGHESGASSDADAGSDAGSDSGDLSEVG